MPELRLKLRPSDAGAHMLNPKPSSKYKISGASLERKMRHLHFHKEGRTQHSQGGDGAARQADRKVPLLSLGHGVASGGCLPDWLSLHLRWVRPRCLRGCAGCDYPVPARNVWLLQVSTPKRWTPLTPKG